MSSSRVRLHQHLLEGRLIPSKYFKGFTPKTSETKGNSLEDPKFMKFTKRIPPGSPFKAVLMRLLNQEPIILKTSQVNSNFKKIPSGFKGVLMRLLSQPLNHEASTVSPRLLQSMINSGR